MSETKCTECECDVIQHSSENFYALHYNPVGSREKCLCTRTYESLVGEMPQTASVGDIYVRDGDHRKFYCHKVNEWTEIEEKPEPSLQLLICDFGDTCIVRAEKGETALTVGNGLWRVSSNEFAYRTVTVYKPFTELRSAIDGKKPVPRIEVDLGGYLLIEADHDTDYFAQSQYEALSELAGKTLPIWKGGKWERLNTHDWTQAKQELSRHNEESGDQMGIDTHSFEEAICPVKIWRYKR